MDMAHFPEIGPEIKQYAADTALKKSRYLFTSRNGRRQTAYCTHCNETSQVQHLHHNLMGECPNCKSLCTVKASGRGRQAMIDEVYFVYYEKSEINPQAMVARGIIAVRDYSESYYGVQTQFVVKAWYVFEPGGGHMAKRTAGYWGGKAYYYEKSDCKTVHSLFDDGEKHNTGWGWPKNPKRFPDCCAFSSMKKAVEGTVYRFSKWDRYQNGDHVKFFEMYSKYPRMEYLLKCGFEELVYARVEGARTYGAINWRGATLQKILKLNKKDIRDIRGPIQKVNFYEQMLYVKLYQLSKADKSNLNAEEIAYIARNFGSYFDEIQQVMKHTTMRKFSAYVTKQFSKGEKEKHYAVLVEALRSWRDYISDCEALEMDLANERVLFPANLYQAHQNTIKQRKIQGSAITSKKIAARLDSLKKYCFEAAGLLIRPAESSKELIDEGKALEHCVGTYADRYANGEIVILVVRKEDQPEKPFYTMEIRKESIVQCRGRKNCQMSKPVEDFVEKFKAAKLRAKTEDVRIRVAVPA